MHLVASFTILIPILRGQQWEGMQKNSKEKERDVENI